YWNIVFHVQVDLRCIRWCWNGALHMGFRRPGGLFAVVLPYGGILGMHVSTEPVSWAEPLENLRSCNASKCSVFRFFLEVGLESVELAVIALPRHATRPVMAESNIDLGSQLKQLARIKLPDVVYTPDVVLVVR